MVTSSDVAAHAGLSRSTVSQILNGRGHLFAEGTIARVRASAEALGYRPSMAGRSLARGTSDIVITLIPDVTFNSRLRELVDLVTDGLADAGLTNFLRFTGADSALDDVVLGLRPFGVISLAPLSGEQRERLQAQGVRTVEYTTENQVAIDQALGRLQARHLAEAGYSTVAIALPVAAREQTFAAAREAGFRESAQHRGLRMLPALHVAFERGGSEEAVDQLMGASVGVAAYNDEVALALVGAAVHRGRRIPEDLGIIGIDNSPLARASTPTITTVDYDIRFSGDSIVAMLLQRPDREVPDAAARVEAGLTVVQGQTTREVGRD